MPQKPGPLKKGLLFRLAIKYRNVCKVHNKAPGPIPVNGHRQLLVFLRKKGRKVAVKISVRYGGVTIIHQLYLLTFKNKIIAIPGISEKNLTAHYFFLCVNRRKAINTDHSLSVLK